MRIPLMEYHQLSFMNQNQFTDDNWLLSSILLTDPQFTENNPWKLITKKNLKQISPF